MNRHTELWGKKKIDVGDLSSILQRMPQKTVSLSIAHSLAFISVAALNKVHLLHDQHGLTMLLRKTQPRLINTV